ncbi:hypothetical protein SPRG_10004 [Saprolegnia parasitica CBS 223.65]|uniref:Dol-P-Glc:Glc(2)Man(9)GlcNAc(2)-PP-Dol alpha-1,2-glucosyltransferase n=1 Tax=Saprolegnia parasitica (strain CBS 223.65) TaxID=695850 RepID=A0A067C9K9_SAPPC|nr:hypothetical protein SPRG_10004 [Saprolegnia parasitica CBS 223.65]KDO23196.1 hypothetical protein SPRG_10004 [Saprolegnia parasitica CBS 223.65]|eukprot:XP_012206147.1 hypothetical protein SPRG_10004 [Saprolegnia parasitica CBS 223.65]
MTSSSALGATAVVGASYAAIAYLFHVHAPQAYMDEIFHVPQTQQYCQGHWDTWDPKITTFPGLYVAGVAFANVVHVLQTFSVSVRIAYCSTTVLRVVNLLFGIGNVYLIVLLRQMKEYTAHERTHATAHGLMIALFPINVFFSFLYYTDVAGLFFVLLMYLLSRVSQRQRLRAGSCTTTYLASVLCGYLAVAMRQTNVLWVLFVLGTAIVQDIETTHETHLYDDGAGATSSCSLGIVLLKFLTFLLKDSVVLVKRYWPTISILAAFGAFLAVNGAITVGDTANHVAGLHVAQLLYFMTLATMGFGLVCPSIQRVAAVRLETFFRDVAHVLTSSLGSCLTSIAVVVALVLAIDRFSLTHPFLLADNRHYTFYIWQRFYLKHALAKFVPLPVYMYAAWFLWKELRKATTLLWLVVFGLATALALVPSPLVEPRYFLVPFTLLHLHSPKQPLLPVLLTSAVFLAINAATIYVFLFRPFTWVDGSVARFMW